MTADLSRSHSLGALPWLWLAMSLLWLVVVIVTDQPAWPLALWIATTIGPFIYLRNSKHQSEPYRPDTKGSHE